MLVALLDTILMDLKILQIVAAEYPFNLKIIPLVTHYADCSKKENLINSRDLRKLESMDSDAVSRSKVI